MDGMTIVADELNQKAIMDVMWWKIKHITMKVEIVAIL